MNKYSEIIKRLITKFNFKIEHKNSWYKRNEHFIAEIDENELNIIKKISNYSMSTPANHWAIIQSIKHIFKNNIEGDFVECGVWKGGNLILFKIISENLNMNNQIYAFDTFEGMPNANEFDKDYNDELARDLMLKNEKNPNINNIHCYSTYEEVVNNVSKYTDIRNIKFIKGKVEDTLLENKNLPRKISILRLDTDWYESTKIELEILFPKLSNGGILIIDDYGQWKGSRKAVDEFFFNKNVVMNYVDFSCRVIIKNL